MCYNTIKNSYSIRRYNAMKVNYMVELNRLNRWEMTNPLNPTE